MISAAPIKDSGNEDTGKWRVTSGDVTIRVDPESVNSMRAAVKELGITRNQIRAAIKRAEEPGDSREPFVVHADGETYSDEIPLRALDAACCSGAKFLRWAGVDTLCAVDVDVREAFSDDELHRVVRACAPERAWLSRGGGLRLVFLARDFSAYERAVGAVLLSEIALDSRVVRVEFLPRTRPPGGRVTKDAGTLSHAIGFAEGRCAEVVEDSAVDQWLGDRGISVGERVDHTFCPVSPGPTDSARDPVVVLDGGLYCFRCSGQTGDGFRSFAWILEGRTHTPHPVCESARERVHWAHMAEVMRADWPDTLPWAVAEPGYRGLCRALGAEDTEIASIFDPYWTWLRGEGGTWLNGLTMEPEGIDKALPALSWTRGLSTRVASSQNAGPLAGYRPVRPVSVVLRPEALNGVVPLQKPRAVPIQLDRGDAMPWGESFGELAGDFTGINETYVKALLSACACAEIGARPVALVITGPSGSAKSTTAAVVSGLLGAAMATVRIDTEPEAWRRQIGQALASGARPLLLNEIDKVHGLRKHSTKLLDLAHPHQYRPLHGVDVLTPFRAPLVITGINLPPMFRESPEMGRRYRHLRLAARVGSEWDALDPGSWRDSHPRAADSLIMWALEFCRAHAHCWEDIAGTLGLPEAHKGDPEENEIRRTAMRALYDHCRDVEGRTMSDATRFPSEHGWVVMDGIPAIVEVLMPMQVGNVDPRFILNQDLSATDWYAVLGVPGVGFEARIHYSHWVGRFVQAGGNRNARLMNESLPDPV